MQQRIIFTSLFSKNKAHREGRWGKFDRCMIYLVEMKPKQQELLSHPDDLYIFSAINEMSFRIKSLSLRIMIQILDFVAI